MVRSGRFLRLGLVAAGAALVMPAPVAAEPTWLAPIRVPSVVAGPTAPVDAKAAFGADGTLAVVWTARSPAGDQSIFAAVRPPGEALSAPALISRAGQTADSPDVAVAGSGLVVATWRRFDGAKWIAVAAERSPAGDWSSPRDLSLAGQDATDVGVAINASGQAVAIWSRLVSITPVAQVARRTGPNAWAGAQVISALDRIAVSPRIGIDGAGNAIAVWVDAGTPAQSAADIRTAVRPAGGVWNPHRLVSNEPFASEDLDLAVNAGGQAVAAWATGPTYRASLRSATGNWSQAATVSDGHNGSDAPAAGIDDAGNATVAFEFGGSAIFVATATPGQPWEPDSLTGDQFSDVVLGGLAVSRRGDAIVGYRGTPTVQPSVVNQAATRAAGRNWDVPQPLDPPGVPSGVAIDEAGNAVATWHSGTQLSISARDASGPDIRRIVVPATATAGQTIRMTAAAADRWSVTGALSWSFGDGARAVGANVTHAYSRPGTYTVRVASTDAVGNASAATRPITVTAVPVVTPTPTPTLPECGRAGRGDGRPIGVTVGAAARYTNDSRVQLSIVAPDAATGLLISNDGGFTRPFAGPISGGGGYPWSLDSSGPERLPKTVYVRFVGGCVDASQTFQDDIILDQTAPTLRGATVRAPVKGGRRPFTLRVRAADNASGVSRLEVRRAKARIFAAKFKRKVRLTGPTKGLTVRVRDGAGNRSPWKKVKVTRGG